MIKLSNDNPNKVYSEGIEALSEDHKNKDSNIVDFLEFLKVRTLNLFIKVNQTLLNIKVIL